MRLKIPAALLAVSACLPATSAWALQPKDCDAKGQDGGGACFGTELTFTNDDILKNDPNGTKEYQKKYLTKWRDALLAICPATRNAQDAVACRLELTGTDPACDLQKRASGDDVIPDKTGFRVCIYGNTALAWTQTWSYTVGTDQGCMELGSKPMNVAWVQAMSNKNLDGNTTSILGKFLFNVAASLHADANADDELQARKVDGGGGHVHIDAQSAFQNNPIQMLNFMTDLHNLQMFPLEPDEGSLILNSPPLAMLWPEQRTAYRAIIEDYKQLENPPNTFEALQALGTQVRNRVYYAAYDDRILQPTTNKNDELLLRQRAALYLPTTDISKMSASQVQQALRNAFGERLASYEDENGEGWAWKAHDIRMDLDRYGTIELRNIAAQASPEELLALLGLLNDRVAVTEKKDVVELLAEGNLKLSQSADDKYLSFRVRPAKFYVENDLSKPQSIAIAQKFKAYVVAANANQAKSRLKVLVNFMPKDIQTKTNELIGQMQ